MKILFWLSWPVQYVVLWGSRRTRVLIVADDRVLLLEGLISPGAWELPGGGLHKNEQITAGAAREVQEETGLIIEPTAIRPLLTEPSHQYGLHFTFVGLETELPQPVDPLRLSWAHTKAQWFKPSELAELRIASDSARVLQAWFKHLKLVQ